MSLTCIRRLVFGVVLLMLTGCAGTSTDGGGLTLPRFSAPDQWEPTVRESPAQETAFKDDVSEEDDF